MLWTLAWWRRPRRQVTYVLKLTPQQTLERLAAYVGRESWRATPGGGSGVSGDVWGRIDGTHFHLALARQREAPVLMMRGRVTPADDVGGGSRLTADIVLSVRHWIKIVLLALIICFVGVFMLPRPGGHDRVGGVFLAFGMVAGVVGAMISAAVRGRREEQRLTRALRELFEADALESAQLDGPRGFELL